MEAQPALGTRRQLAIGILIRDARTGCILFMGRLAKIETASMGSRPGNPTEVQPEDEDHQRENKNQSNPG